MSNVTYTPNMNIPTPVPGQDPGPDYANNQVAGNNVIDGHDHSNGKGVPVNPSGLNINADLPFNSNNATLLRSARFVPQGSAISLPTDLSCLYTVANNTTGSDLYFNQGNGTQVQITANGAVFASSSGLSSGDASAAFSGVDPTKTLIVNQNTNTPGNIQAGSILIGNNVSGSNFITLAAPNSLAASYQLTLPAGIASSNGSLLTSNTSGNLSYTLADNTTIVWSGGTLSLATGGITNANISNSAGIAKTKLAGGPVFSSSCGTFSTSSTTPVQITNFDISITGSGNPIKISMVADSSGNTNSGVMIPAAYARIFCYNVTTASYVGRYYFGNGSTANENLYPASMFSFIDTSPAVGVNEYQILLDGDSAGYIVEIFNSLMYAEEM